MRSPGRPMPARHVEREFWRLIALGRRTEDAALEVGVSWPVGVRWFRHAGGMPPICLGEPTGRYLSFEEREEIARLLDSARGAQAAQIFIGAENKLFSLSGSSVIAAPYRGKEGRVVGVVGVIGPTRLNYARVVPMVDFTAQALTRLMAL